MHGITRPILGCSTWSNYDFLLPFTALLWRERIGYEPFIFLTGNWERLERSRLVLRQLEARGFEVYRLPEIMDEGTLAQNCRQHAAVMPFPDGAWLLTTDADLWPIKKDFYWQHYTSSPETVVAYYANGDHYQSYPTCHIAATAKVWRSIYGIKEQGVTVAEHTKASHEAWKQASAMYARENNKPFAVWCSDQWMMTEKIKASGFPVKHIERKGHPPIDRIDREGLPENWTKDPELFTDAHVHKGPFQPERWPDVLRLASGLLPKSADWFKAYRERYFEAFQAQPN